MEAARTYETLVNVYQTTQRYNPENSHLPKDAEFHRDEDFYYHPILPHMPLPLTSVSTAANTLGRSKSKFENHERHERLSFVLYCDSRDYERSDLPSKGSYH
jgi:hypothetical protein